LTRFSDALVLVAAFTIDLALAVFVAGVSVFPAFLDFLEGLLDDAFLVVIFAVFSLGSAFARLVRAPSTRDRRPGLPRLRAPPSAASTSEWARAAASSWMASVNRSTNAVTTWATK
jgi:hypothetical protein